MVPSDHGSLGDFSLWVVNDSACAFKSKHEWCGGVVDSCAVVGIDVVNAGNDDVDKHLILSGSGGRDLDILENFWAASLVDLNCVHIQRLSQRGLYMQQNRPPRGWPEERNEDASGLLTLSTLRQRCSTRSVLFFGSGGTCHKVLRTTSTT